MNGVYMDEVYKEYSKLVYKYLLGLTHNPDVAEELTQDTFYSAVKNIHNFRNECTMKAWLCRIAKNKWINIYNRNKKVSIKFNTDNIDDLIYYDTTIDSIISKEEIIELYKNINKLDAETREVIYLRIKAELKFSEISAILNKNEDCVRMIFFRGKIKLKEMMNNE